MKRVTKLLTVLVMLACLLLAALTVLLPFGTDSTTAFQLSRIKQDLKTIAKEPHSPYFDTPAIAEVREYLIDSLTDCGAQVQTFSYSAVPTHKDKAVDLNNIYAKLEGESGSYILLVSHYDSAVTNPQGTEGYSNGAADAGYGVATILETVRCLTEQGHLYNGIKILLTDGEELRLLGSTQAIQDNTNDVFEDVAFVVNLEARGTAGPVMLYETNGNQERVLNLYTAGEQPVTASLLTELYDGSDRSDFYNLRKRGLPGVNLIVLDRVEYYHTPKDSYENISEKTLRHYAAQVVAITKEFVTNTKYADVNYFRDSDNQVFFTLLPNVVVRYGETAALVISLALLVVVAVLLVRRRRCLGALLRLLRNRLLLVFGVFAAALLISFLLALATGTAFQLAHMGKIPGDDILVFALPVLLFLLLLRSRCNQAYDTDALYLSGLAVQGVLLAAALLFLPGASYLLMLPLGLSLAVYGLRRCTKNAAAVTFLWLFPIVAIVLLTGVYFFHFQMAFSIAALALNCTLSTLLYLYCAPIFRMMRSDRRIASMR